MDCETIFSQHPPMYLYKFLQALTPLSAPYVPDYIDLGAGTVIFACADRKTAQEYIKDLPPQGEHFLLYAKKDNLSALLFRDVTPQIQYLESLNAELNIPVADEDCSLLSAALFEAAYLFDLLKSLDLPELFAPLGGFSELEAVYSDNRLRQSEMPVLAHFDDNPLTLRIFIAQTKFFFAQYLRFSFFDYALAPASDSIIRDFDDLVYQEIIKMRGGNCWKSKNFTGVENLEFDYFAQQLELLVACDRGKILSLLCPNRKKSVREDAEAIFLEACLREEAEQKKVKSKIKKPASEQ